MTANMNEKETEFFFYQTAEGQVTITKYKDTGSVAEIPSVVEEMPVTVLGDYAFSGLPVEEVRLPASVKKIGRYGFYNCRSLKKLSFGSKFMDMGSGAFTGCHQINCLEVNMEEEESGLKEILSEVREEMVVRMDGICRAVLWFPEFYEEGVENTPARILMTHVHGSGIYYRNCFRGKKFNFAEYDKRFVMAKALESRKFLMELVTGRLRFPWQLTEEARTRYEEYLWENYKAMALFFIDGKREEELEWLLKEYPLTLKEKKIYEEILEYASGKGSPAVTGMMMDLGRKLFPVKRKTFDL